MSGQQISAGGSCLSYIVITFVRLFHNPDPQLKRVSLVDMVSVSKINMHFITLHNVFKGN